MKCAAISSNSIAIEKQQADYRRNIQKKADVQGKSCLCSPELEHGQGAGKPGNSGKHTNSGHQSHQQGIRCRQVHRILVGRGEMLWDKQQNAIDSIVIYGLNGQTVSSANLSQI